jgi:hypothetical protein
VSLIRTQNAFLPPYPCFSRYSFRKKTLSSQPKFIFFNLPSWEISPEQAAVKVSSPTSPDITSLAMNDGELRDSTGERRRIDIVNGLGLFAKENTWGSGFSRDEMEWDSVGDNDVGGSYLNTGLAVKCGEIADGHTPNTHDENFVSLDGNWTALEQLRKFKESSTIAGRAFRKDDNGSI